VSDWQVRAAAPGDRVALQRIFREASLSNHSDRANLLAHPQALLLGPVDADRTRVAFAPGGTVVGFATIVPGHHSDADGWDPTGRSLELEDLFVDPDRMRQGVGRTLVDDAVASARAGGFTRIEVTANPHALTFYRAVGFVRGADADTAFGPAPRLHRDLS
jgi:GNAT superfamily N-acetyltransferase